LARVDAERPLTGPDELAADALAVGRAESDRPPDDAREVWAAPERPLGARRRDVDRVLVEVIAQDFGDALTELVVDALRMVDEDRHPFGAGELEREDLDSGHAALDARGDLAIQRALLFVEIRQSVLSKKTGAAR